MKKISHFRKKAFIISFIIFIFFFIFFKIKDDHFSLIKIQNVNEKNIELDETLDLEKINSILNQKFYYLIRGKQFFVFLSEDKKHVIKFYDRNRNHSDLFFPNISMPKKLDNMRKGFYERRRKRFLKEMESLKMAYENFKEDCALEYVHLAATNNLGKVILLSKFHDSFEIDLNSTIFVLQKRYDENFFVAFEKTKDNSLKEGLLDSFLRMIDKRCKKLIIDDDMNEAHDNWAVLDNEVFNIDIGKWYFDEKLKDNKFYKKEMIKASKALKKYLEKNDIEMSKVLDAKMVKYFENFKS